MEVSGQHHARGRALSPGKGPPVLTGQEARWVQEPVWTQRLKEKSSASVGDRTPVVQSVVRHYTDWAIPAPFNLIMHFLNREVAVLTEICLKNQVPFH
jgi:hypothetical protein